MIRRFPERLMQGSSRTDPTAMVDACAELGCGCAAWYGFLVERGPGKPVLIFRACAGRHNRLIEVAQKAFTGSGKTAAAEDALSLADELLRLAEASLRPA